jgi:hypothetical protein
MNWQIAIRRASAAIALGGLCNPSMGLVNAIADEIQNAYDDGYTTAEEEHNINMISNAILNALKSGDYVVTEEGKGVARSVNWSNWTVAEAQASGYLEHTEQGRERTARDEAELRKFMGVE